MAQQCLFPAITLLPPALFTLPPSLCLPQRRLHRRRRFPLIFHPLLELCSPTPCRRRSPPRSRWTALMSPSLVRRRLKSSLIHATASPRPPPAMKTPSLRRLPALLSAPRVPLAPSNPRASDTTCKCHMISFFISLSHHLFVICANFLLAAVERLSSRTFPVMKRMQTTRATMIWACSTRVLICSKETPTS